MKSDNFTSLWRRHCKETMIRRQHLYPTAQVLTGSKSPLVSLDGKAIGYLDAFISLNNPSEHSRGKITLVSKLYALIDRKKVFSMSHDLKQRVKPNLYWASKLLFR